MKRSEDLRDRLNTPLMSRFLIPKKYGVAVVWLAMIAFAGGGFITVDSINLVTNAPMNY